jgi:hypothetical protein
MIEKAARRAFGDAMERGTERASLTFGNGRRQNADGTGGGRDGLDFDESHRRSRRDGMEKGE